MSEGNNWNETVETRQNDFEPMRFSDLEVDETFWINDSTISTQNQIWRKQNDNEAVNLRTSDLKRFNLNDTIFMRV